jgi:hypothetical protein
MNVNTLSYCRRWLVVATGLAALLLSATAHLRANTIEDVISESKAVPEPLMWIGTNAPTQTESEDLYNIVTNFPAATWRQDLLGYIASHPDSP